MEIIRFENVVKRYGSVKAVDGVSFSLHAHTLTALAGPSGSGKTTLLNLAAGLDAPSEGNIWVAGICLSRLKASALACFRCENIGFVFQSYNLIPVLTVLENVEYPLALRGVRSSVRALEAKKALSEVGMEGYLKRFPSELSGGQQQRVAVARALVGYPKIIFADEPTGSLDAKNAEMLLTLFQGLNQKLGTTFLFSSHDPRVLNKAGQVLTVQDGAIIESHSPLLSVGKKPLVYAKAHEGGALLGNGLEPVGREDEPTSHSERQCSGLGVGASSSP